MPISRSVLFGLLSFGAAILWPDWAVRFEIIAMIMAALVSFWVHDLHQTKHAILRNYPIAAHLRFVFEKVRPEMWQYFFEAERDGLPYPRDQRAIAYQRAK